MTDKLSKAFKLVHIPVTKEMEKEEELVISISKEQFRQKILERLLKQVKESGFDIDGENNED